ncbi:MAG: hypothetical protein IT436_11865 [Phycisphaerales bacterium]|nr:hypothetical protein [Phycisphaerales bacterium]
MVRCAELLEAEGRMLRANSIHVGLALAALLTASFTAVLAIGFFVAAVYLGLRSADLGPAPSALICGGICTILSATFVWIGRSMVK